MAANSQLKIADSQRARIRNRTPIDFSTVPWELPVACCLAFGGYVTILRGEYSHPGWLETMTIQLVNSVPWVVGSLGLLFSAIRNPRYWDAVRVTSLLFFIVVLMTFCVIVSDVFSHISRRLKVDTFHALKT